MRMRNIFTQIKGDRAIWAIATLLAIFSFLPVYSAASNLAYSGGNTNTFSFFIKHFMHLLLGFTILFGVHKVPYKYFRGLSMVMIPIVLVLLLITMLQGTTIEGANASRWIRIPIVNMSFQTSTLAAVVIMVYVARYLSKIKDKKPIIIVQWDEWGRKKKNCGGWGLCEAEWFPKEEAVIPPPNGGASLLEFDETLEKYYIDILLAENAPTGTPDLKVDEDIELLNIQELTSTPLTIFEGNYELNNSLGEFGGYRIHLN